MEDLKANTEYTGYTAASPIVQWFWDVVGTFNKEDMARLLQFITGTSKVGFATHFSLLWCTVTVWNKKPQILKHAEIVQKVWSGYAKFD